MIIRLNMTNIYIWYFCQVRTENVWWRNQGILGVGNRHDNIDPSFYYCAYTTNTKCVERDQKSGYYNHTKACGSSPIIISLLNLVVLSSNRCLVPVHFSIIVTLYLVTTTCTTKYKLYEYY